MSELLTVENPAGRKISFREEDHKYFDDDGNIYRSVTKLIHSLFPEFERDKLSYFVARKRVAKEKGFDNPKDVPVPMVMEEKEIVLQEWEDNKNQSCDLGTKIHRYAECKLKDIPFDMELTEDRQEKLSKTVDKFLPEITKVYEFIEAEKIVFSPEYKIAGTIDLIMRNKNNGKLAILDWKTNKSINKKDSYGKSGNDFLAHIEHSNYWHYAIQLNIYRHILNFEGYGDYTKCEMGLFHINTRTIKGYEIPLMESEAIQVCEYCKNLKGEL